MLNGDLLEHNVFGVCGCRLSLLLAIGCRSKALLAILAFHQNPEFFINFKMKMQLDALF